MSFLRFIGTLPGTMAENSRPGDWAAMLSLEGEAWRVASFEAVGPGASYVSLHYDKEAALLFITPGALADYEAFIAAGQEPEIVFTLNYRQNNGTPRQDSTVFRIALLDIDDTPPTLHGFSDGGRVAAGAIGAVIGTLNVTDPDTQAPFHYRIAPEDEWRFEILGNTLKLRDGISLGLDDMGTRPLLLEVSDGRNSAGFTLEIEVTDPGGAPFRPPAMAPGELRGTVALASEGRALVLREAHALAGLESGPGGDRRIALRDGTETALPGVQRIDFADGRLDLDPQGMAALAAALHRALHGTEADGAALGRSVAALEGGASLSDLAAARVTGMAAEEEAFVASLYQGALGRAPDAAELALQLGRLASGVERAQLALDVALGAAALERLAESHPGGFWVALPHGLDAPSARAHGPSWDAAGPAPPPFATDLLLF